MAAMRRQPALTLPAPVCCRDRDRYSWTPENGRVHNLRMARMSARTGSVLVLLVILTAACGINPKPSAVGRTTMTAGKASVILEAGGVTVSPSNGLHDGQQVEVQVKGFPPGWKVFVSECSTPLEANPLGCGGQLATQPFDFISQNGDGSIPFIVHASAGMTPDSQMLSPCSGECVVVATIGTPVGTRVHGIYFAAPISFADG